MLTAIRYGGESMFSEEDFTPGSWRTALAQNANFSAYLKRHPP